MHVQLNCGKDYDGFAQEELLIDGKHVLSAGSMHECPEDACLERDLIGPSKIVKYMKMAYEEGKAGREIIFTEGEIEKDE